MKRTVYKVWLDEKEIAIFYELEDVTIFIKGLCERYYNQIEFGLNFTIKEELL